MKLVTNLNENEAATGTAQDDTNYDDDVTVCSDCGQSIEEYETIYVYDEEYCYECAKVCTACSDGVVDVEVVVCAICRDDFCSDCCPEAADGKAVCVTCRGEEDGYAN